MGSYGPGGPNPRLSDTDYQMLWLQRVAWVAEIVEASGKAESASAAEAIAALRDLDRTRLARAVELAYEHNRREMGWRRWVGEAEAIAAEYAALRAAANPEREPSDAD